MEHFQDSAWADYVRGVAGKADAAAMAAHLAAGCTRCKETMGRFGDVARVAIEDMRSSPPKYVIQAARSIFALRQPQRVQIHPRLHAHLVFDSFCIPVPAGMRSGQPMTRQVLYEAGPYAIDLCLDHRRGSRHVWLTGQIVSTGSADRIDEIEVALTAGDRIAAQAMTNATGEFQFQYEPHPQLQLRIDVRADEPIELPLVTQADESAEGGRE